MEMAKSEICARYERNKSNQQIKVLAELNATDTAEIKKILIEAGKLEPQKKPSKKNIEMPVSVSMILFARLDELEKEIKEIQKTKDAKEKEYLEMVEFMKEFGKEKEN